MDNIRKQVFKDNRKCKIEYIMSLAGLFCAFSLFTLLTDTGNVRGYFLMGILIAISAFDVVRYYADRYLYVTDGNMVSGQIKISIIVRFHAFNADKYFEGIKIHMPVLWIVIFTAMPVSVVLLAGEKGIWHAAAIFAAGVAGVFMAVVSYQIKKRIFTIELVRGTDTAFNSFLKIAGAVFRVFEAVYLIIASAVTAVLSLVFFSALIEPKISENEFIYRSYTDFNAYIFLILAFAALIFGLVNYSSKRMHRIMFILSGIFLAATILLSYIQTRKYTEISENKFSVYDFGLVGEYDLRDVRKFKVYKDDFAEELQLEITFDDKKTYKVIGRASSANNLCEEMFYSDYNMAAYYVGKFLENGAEGTLEDREELKENARSLHENVYEGWKEIEDKMDGK